MSPRKSTKIEKEMTRFAAYDKNGKLLILSHSSKVVKVCRWTRKKEKLGTSTETGS